MTIIFKRHFRLSNGQLCHAGDEVASGLFDQPTIDGLFDSDVVVEAPSRLSYYQLLPDFSGVGATERLDVASMFPALAIPRLDSRAQKSDTVQSS
jgi:hypothetical protein